MPRESEPKGFRYQRRSAQDVRERANKKSGDFDSIFKSKYKVFKVKEGKNLIRILPPTWENASHYGYDIWVNYNIGADNQAYLSLNKMKGEKDPIFEAKKEAERDGDKKLAKALSPRERVLVWVIDRNAEEEGPQLWAAPVTFDKDLAKVTYDEDTKDLLEIDHPEEGNDIRFYREGMGLNTNYDPLKIKPLPKSPLHEDQQIQDDWLSFVEANPLPECLNFYDYEHINMVFGGQVGSRDDAPEAEKAPARGRRETTEEPAPRRAAAAREEPEAPASRRRVVVDEAAEAEAETPAPRARTRAAIDEEPAPARPSIRDRLSARRAAPADAEDDIPF